MLNNLPFAQGNQHICFFPNWNEKLLNEPQCFCLKLIDSLSYYPFLFPGFLLFFHWLFPNSQDS